jgi:hypothetical protein
MAKQIVSALDDLQWLAKIVASYGEQYRLEVRNPARSGSASHAPRYASRCAGHCPKIPVTFFRPDMVALVAHHVPSQVRSQKDRLLAKAWRDPSAKAS